MYDVFFYFVIKFGEMIVVDDYINWLGCNIFWKWMFCRGIYCYIMDDDGGFKK